VGKGCEPLYQNSGGGRVTDSPPPRGEPAQTHDYSAHAHWDHDSVRSAANGRECSFQPTALDDLSIQFGSGTILQEGSRSFEPASLGAASPAVKSVASWAKSLKGGIRVPQSVRAAGEGADSAYLRALRDDQRPSWPAPAGLSRSARLTLGVGFPDQIAQSSRIQWLMAVLGRNPEAEEHSTRSRSRRTDRSRGEGAGAEGVPL